MSAPRGRRGALAKATALAALCCGLGCGVFDETTVDTIPAEDFVLDCPLYCAVVMHRCKGPVTAFLSLEACNEACATFPNDGLFGTTSGNTLQCRFSFALAAHKNTRHVFCRNAGLSGGTSCR